MQQFEDELGVEVFDHRSRPPLLTPIGAEIAKQARDVMAEIEKIRVIATGQDVAGSVSIGFVPTTHLTLLPLVLDELREAYPQLRVVVRSGLSGELAASVLQKELDFAILTSPATEIPDLDITEIASEPLYVIGPATQSDVTSDAALARSMPFISFSKATWLGQHIASLLQLRGIHINEVIEIASVDAIEKLVVNGFGVSIIPQRLFAEPLSDKLVRIPFCQPVEVRKLVLIQHAHGRKTSLEAAVRDICVNLHSAANN